MCALVFEYPIWWHKTLSCQEAIFNCLWVTQREVGDVGDGWKWSFKKKKMQKTQGQQWGLWKQEKREESVIEIMYKSRWMFCNCGELVTVQGFKEIRISGEKNEWQKWRKSLKFIMITFYCAVFPWKKVSALFLIIYNYTVKYGYHIFYLFVCLSVYLAPCLVFSCNQILCKATNWQNYNVKSAVLCSPFIHPSNNS